MWKGEVCIKTKMESLAVSLPRTSCRTSDQVPPRKQVCKPPTSGRPLDSRPQTRCWRERKGMRGRGGSRDGEGGEMGEAVSALPSAGRSSGRRSSLGPLSEREERMLGSHVHHLLHPVVPKSGQTGEERQARGSDSGAWQSDPQTGSGILTEHRHAALSSM